MTFKCVVYRFGAIKILLQISSLFPSITTLSHTLLASYLRMCKRIVLWSCDHSKSYNFCCPLPKITCQNLYLETVKYPYKCLICRMKPLCTQPSSSAESQVSSTGAAVHQIPRNPVLSPQATRMLSKPSVLQRDAAASSNDSREKHFRRRLVPPPELNTIKPDGQLITLPACLHIGASREAPFIPALWDVSPPLSSPTQEQDYLDFLSEQCTKGDTPTQTFECEKGGLPANLGTCLPSLIEQEDFDEYLRGDRTEANPCVQILGHDIERPIGRVKSTSLTAR